MYLGYFLGTYSGLYTFAKHTTIPSLGIVLASTFGCGTLGAYIGSKFPKSTKLAIFGVLLHIKQNTS